MKKICSTIMMLAMMFAALSFTACSKDDEEKSNGGGGTTSSTDFIEITLFGKTYHHDTKPMFYVQIDPIGKDDHGTSLTSTYSMEDDWDTDSFGFYYGLIHYSRTNELLATKTGSYLCEEVLLMNEVFQNMTFSPQLYMEGNSYDLVSGSHQVTSIKKVGEDVQVEGTFTAIFEYDDEQVNVRGSYRMTIPS